MPGTYGKTWWREGWACGCMIQSIEKIIEPRLRKAGILGPTEQVDIFQEAYTTGVSASANTHAGGGALDHGKGSDAETIIWRECGVADWQRGSPEDSFFDDHNHGIWIGCPHLSKGAEDQVDDYQAGRNGLAGEGADRSPRVAYTTWQHAYDTYIGQAGGEGILDMTKSVYQRRSTDDVVKLREDWDDLKVNEKNAYSVLSGNYKQVSCSANVTVTNLKAGEWFSIVWRIAKYKAGTATSYPYSRAAVRANCGRDGEVLTLGAVYNGAIPAPTKGFAHKLRLSYKTNSKTAKVTSVLCEGWRSED